VSILGTEMSCLYLITSGFSFLINKWQCGSLYILFNYLEAAVSYQSSFLCSYSCILKKTGFWKSHSTNLNWLLHTHTAAGYLNVHIKFNKIKLFLWSIKLIRTSRAHTNAHTVNTEWMQPYELTCNTAFTLPLLCKVIHVTTWKIKLNTWLWKH